MFFLITGLLLSPALSIRADTAYVGWDSNSGFSPDTVSIHPGDTVAWTDNDPDFPTYVTSDAPFGDPNYFQVPLFNEGDTYGVVFNSTGTFGYHDDYGDNGSVTVTAVAPAINLTSPRLAENQFLFDATGLDAGKTNVLEISTNLTLWTAIQTNVADNSSITFTNTIIAGSHFYRLLELP